ncbi:MAG: heme ABC transporter ATP-binding protein [Halanaeroarchaeum sp.]
MIPAAIADLFATAGGRSAAAPPSDGSGRVRIEDVSVALGGQSILEDVSLSVESGQFLGLIGPNGAGKTTLLRTITGVLSPDGGSVEVAGLAVADAASRAVSRRVAAVPQDTHLAFEFDVRSIVAMGRTPYRSRVTVGRPDAAAVEDAMVRARVEHLADRSVDAVSGGERQRVLLARALAQDTPILVLDEPTASLDINHQVRTLEIVRSLVDDGRTVIAAIHDLNLAAHYCDELALLSGGDILAQGPPSTVLTEDRLETAFGTRAVVTRHPVTGSVSVMAVPRGTTETNRERVHVVGGGGTGARLLYVLTAAGFDVSTGALTVGDSDLDTARHLGVDRVTVPPGAGMDEDATTAVREHVREAAVTVVADVEIGVGNLPNLEAAAEADHLVLVEERPFEERNYAGPGARSRYDSLRSRATVVDATDVLQAVESTLDDADGSSA